MKKPYQNPKMNLVEIDEWQSVICTSTEDGISVAITEFGSDDTGGFNQSNSNNGAPRRNGPWDE